MPDNSLPDEIISEILSPALTVDDDVFSHNWGVSPFASYSESTSAYLLVCKSWLRVATPLLYNVVILRSKAQAKALARALSGNTDLGRFIKKLRVEGGYGPAMHTVLQCVPNVSDLLLSLEIYSSDSTDGLCKGLRLINPTRLILRDNINKPMTNKMAMKLVNALAEAILNWKCLLVFDWPYSEYSSDHKRIESIVRPLLQANRLQTVVARSTSHASWTYEKFKKCPLQNIRFKTPVYEDSRWHPLMDPTIKSLLRYAKRPALCTQQSSGIELSYVAPSLNPFFTPMSSTADDVQDGVWSRVLYFAHLRKDVSPRLALLLVSKRFYRLGLQYYYEHVVLKNSRTISNLALTLSQRPSLGAHIRTIYASLRADQEYPYFEFGLDNEFPGDSSLGDSGSAIIPVDALPMLEELRVRDSNESFLTALSLMKLASLRSAAFLCHVRSEGFLQTHGHRLNELEITIVSVNLLSVCIFALCPNLSHITVLSASSYDTAPPNEAKFLSRNPAASLGRIDFIVPLQTKKDILTRWEEFFATFSHESFPNLREISIDCFRWPTNEREIAKSPWVRVAEKLLKEDMHLMDKTGKKWRSRLKMKRIDGTG
ncbi:hypothetical protein GGX14DRAFT_698178 [Mycena pura]|uniref:Uncharacterized protein n=1 Tax=Mycena pura TaxID=153505 RepID=A0AAD6VHS5_9AGAR|nr:hypothetical protein GGX14DRAFT_698178 [Mycena pura]